jgi:hypothetical protein
MRSIPDQKSTPPACGGPATPPCPAVRQAAQLDVCRTAPLLSSDDARELDSLIGRFLAKALTDADREVIRREPPVQDLLMIAAAASTMEAC